MESLQLAAIRKLYRALAEHPQFPVKQKGLAIEKIPKDDAIRALWDAAVAVAVPSPADLTRPEKHGNAKHKGGQTMEPQDTAQGQVHGVPPTEPTWAQGDGQGTPNTGPQTKAASTPQGLQTEAGAVLAPEPTLLEPVGAAEASPEPESVQGKAPKKAPKPKAPKPEDKGTKVSRQRAKPYWRITVNFTDNPRKGKCGARLAHLKTGQTVKEFVEAGGETCDIILGEARGWISLDKAEPVTAPAPVIPPAGIVA